MIQIARRAAASVINAAVNKIIIFFDLDNKLKTKDSDGNLRTIVTEDTSGRSSARPYKVLAFNISQSGTSNPTATVLDNTALVGVSPVFTRHALAEYDIVLSGAFPAGKIAKEMKSYESNAGITCFYSVVRVDDNTARIYTYDDTALTGAEAQFVNQFIEIRIYP